MRLTRRNVLRLCNYCGEDIKRGEGHEYEKFDRIEVVYHLDCWFEAKKEHKLLLQLAGKTIELYLYETKVNAYQPKLKGKKRYPICEF